MSIIKLTNVSKFYYNKKNISSGFNKLNLDLSMGEFVVITGESGSGKSTLLNVISGLDSYEEGEMYINGAETSHYTEVDYENYRRKYIGNIFQHFNLVNSYTVFQNIELVLLLNGYKKKEVKQKVLDIIKTVGLIKYKNTKASKLSGGQKQRVAIARALAKDTPIIVADEPTGNLDVASAKAIMKLLHEISKEKLVVIVTHNYEQVEEYATRKITMHDGKITEDKILTKTKELEAETVKYKDLTKFNKLLLGFRNTFNIKTKFVLLFLVYFFLTIIMFSEYSSLQKMDYDSEGQGYNYYFQNTDTNRVIVNKKDRTSFTEDDISNLKSLANIDRVIENDLMLDMNIGLSNTNGTYYLYGTAYDTCLITSVDEGKMPENENEIILVGDKENYYLDDLDELLNSEYSIRDDRTGAAIEGKYKIVGIKYEDNSDFSYQFKIHVSTTVLNELRKGININYSTTALTFNDQIYSSDTMRFYYNIRPLDRVPDGEAYVFNDMSMYCKNYNCINTNMNVKVKNIYYEDSVDLKIKKTFTKDNFKIVTGLSKYDEISATVFMSKNDYNKLFDKDTYQVSTYLKDEKKSSETIENLHTMGYDTFYMRENLASAMGTMGGIITILRTVVFIVATIALFFISYFIIKIILKSRNVYFSTIRILGATKKISKQLLNIELLVDINIAYLVFIGIVGLINFNVINIAYISDIVEYLKITDYIIVYIILICMSLLISNRYSHKLFKDSVMSTYREEV